MSPVLLLKPVRLALLAGVFGLGFAGQALAQDDTAETVIVTAPYYHNQGGRLNGDPGIESLSQDVSYSDLDIGSREGARELRHRIRIAARTVCERLADTAPGADSVTNCYQTATKNALVRANEAIRDARGDRYYQAGYRGGDERD